MPSFEADLPLIVDGKVQEPTEEQRTQIRKLYAEVAADSFFRALCDIQRAKSDIEIIRKRYDPLVNANNETRDIASFEKRLKDLMLWDAYKNYVAD